MMMQVSEHAGMFADIQKIIIPAFMQAGRLADRHADGQIYWQTGR